MKFYFKLLVLLLTATLLPGVSLLEKPRKVLVLGVDGLDPRLLQKFMDEGVLPNFRRMIEAGDYRPLQTTMPPLSPVAWSTFITGMDPGGHGIYDFVHRDPGNMLPELSMSKALPPDRNLEVGSWVIPLSSGRVEQLRKGVTFWELLEKEGISTTVFRMPANFPPAESRGRSFSGMGTPDILGTPGTFTFYATHPPENSAEISGGHVIRVSPVENQIKSYFRGPRNSFRRVPKQGFFNDGEVENPELQTEFQVYLDPERPLAKFFVQGKEFILREGEWSDWFRVDFEAVPYLVGINAIGRFYLQQVRPEFRLYLTPLQINPGDPAMPLSTPDDWSHELCENLGYFYTQGLPEDTKAFSGGILSGREFWEQAQYVFRERRRALDYFLDKFDEGLLFFYFSSLDQGCHMLWQYMDELHPIHKADEKLAGGIRTLYREIDEAMGYVLDRIDNETTLIVMSDHGFAPFYRGVNLNSWLLDKGYVKLRDPSKRGQYPLFLNVDWSGTTAYALGLNGVYVNLKGREINGIVSPEEDLEELLSRLESDLKDLRDPKTGEQVVTLTVRPARDYHGPYRSVGPDLIVGYNWGYRTSWESPLGEFPEEIFVDNDDPWSGDHGMDHRLVPGVLISNREIILDTPALFDLTVAVLDEFKVAKLPEMIGQDCLGDEMPKGGLRPRQSVGLDGSH
jgi:predicted AlkP superfamily phosphohydrolase/phosphomutase